MKRTGGKPSAGFESSPSELSDKKILATQSESHQMTLHRPFGEKETGSLHTTSIEYHLTIQLTHTTLTRRELSLLLEVLNFQAVNFGVNFTMAMALYDLYFRLLGSKSNSTEIKESRIRLTVTVTEVILKLLKNKDLSLEADTFLEIPSKFKELLSKGLMSKRTYGSRYRTWRPEKYLKVRIVPVDIQFLKRSDNTSRYSSYCKGYGESHPSAHSQKLKPSAEYDGDTVLDPAEEKERNLFLRCTDPIHVLCEYLLIRYANEEEES